MDAFEEIRENLRQTAAVLAKSAKESAERQAQHENEMAKWREQHEEEMARWKAEEEKWKAEERERWAKHEKWREQHEEELAKRQAKMDKLQEKSERKLESVGQQLGSIGMNNGLHFEEVIFTSLYEKKTLGGEKYETVRRNVTDPHGDTEYDILMHNGEASVIIEVKYRAHINDIYDFLAKKPVAFRNGFTGLGHHRLYLGLASGSTYQKLIDEAKEAGIFLLGPKGDSYEVFNKEVRAF